MNVHPDVPDFDEVIAFGLKQCRRYMYVTLMFFIPALISAALGVASLIGLVRTDSLPCFAMSAISLFGSAVLFGNYSAQRKLVQRLRETPNLNTNAHYRGLHRQLRYEQNTPVLRQWVDANKPVVIILILIAVGSFAFAKLLMVVGELLSGWPFLFTVVAVMVLFLVGMRWLTNWLSRRSLLKTIGKFSGARIVIGSMVHFKKAEPQTPVWGVYQPLDHLRSDLSLDRLETELRQIEHLLVLDLPDKYPVTAGFQSLQSALASIHHPDARYVGTVDAAASYLAEHVHPGDVVIVMSPGDATKIGNDLLKRLGQSP